MFAIEITYNNPEEKQITTLFGGWIEDDAGRRHPRLYDYNTEEYLAYTRHEGALYDLHIIESKGYQARIIPDPYPEVQIQ